MTPNRPYNGGDRPYHNKGKTFGPRKNERIRAPKIRVIGPDGKQLGIMTPQEALSIARRNRLDLLEVSPTADPPVCRILDYGKYMYEESKKQKSHKSATIKVKEIKLRPMIEQNDFMTKIRAAEKFLYAGNSSDMVMIMSYSNCSNNILSASFDKKVPICKQPYITLPRMVILKPFTDTVIWL